MFLKWPNITSHFGQNVWKHRLKNTATPSFNTPVRQMTEMFQWLKWLSKIMTEMFQWLKWLCKKWPKRLSEKKQKWIVSKTNEGKFRLCAHQVLKKNIEFSISPSIAKITQAEHLISYLVCLGRSRPSHSVDRVLSFETFVISKFNIRASHRVMSFTVTIRHIDVVQVVVLLSKNVNQKFQFNRLFYGHNSTEQGLRYGTPLVEAVKCAGHISAFGLSVRQVASVYFGERWPEISPVIVSQHT